MLNKGVGMGRLILLVAIGLAGFLFYRVQSQPKQFRIERKRKISATPSQLKALLADFSHDHEWNPFMQNDPQLSFQTSEKPSGVGAKMQWQGKRSGSGMSEILEADQNHVKRSLIMLKPMRADNVVNFTFDLETDGVMLTWSMRGETTTAQKLFSAVFNSEKMIGASFDNGLDQIEAMFAEKHERSTG